MLSQSAIRAAWSPACRGPWASVALHGAGRAVVRFSAVEATKALNECLKRWNYVTRYKDTGAYVCRLKVNGNGYSNHSFGTAIDINWQLNPYGGSRYHMPYAMAKAICQIRTNNGAQVWNWGGFWKGTRDWMHFEIVCRPSDLATGINWRTIPGVTKPPAGVPKPPVNVNKPEPEKEEDDEMKPVVIYHSDNSVWLHQGPFRTKLNVHSTHKENQDTINYWRYLSENRVLDLRKKGVDSQRWLATSVDTDAVNKGIFYSGAGYTLLEKIKSHLKIK